MWRGGRAHGERDQGEEIEESDHLDSKAKVVGRKVTDGRGVRLKGKEDGTSVEEGRMLGVVLGRVDSKQHTE